MDEWKDFPLFILKWQKLVSLTVWTSAFSAFRAGTDWLPCCFLRSLCSALQTREESPNTHGVTNGMKGIVAVQRWSAVKRIPWLLGYKVHDDGMRRRCVIPLQPNVEAALGAVTRVESRCCCKHHLPSFLQVPVHHDICVECSLRFVKHIPSRSFTLSHSSMLSWVL